MSNQHLSAVVCRVLLLPRSRGALHSDLSPCSLCLKIIKVQSTFAPRRHVLIRSSECQADDIVIFRDSDFLAYPAVQTIWRLFGYSAINKHLVYGKDDVLEKLKYDDETAAIFIKLGGHDTSLAPVKDKGVFSGHNIADDNHGPSSRLTEPSPDSLSERDVHVPFSASQGSSEQAMARGNEYLDDASVENTKLEH
ncbi:MAG: hypothetical protein J3Q66DRAFT_420362 [Benniella sp.]|nr:MAG: hypothetical protein J3Q66DRAFT_403459 [Benniella sp.]KAK3825339.1 MAG: hypothetical protein J3Q66DRAFT_396324 [Benniella sp.]KAK3825406.1 MAG: hypothetical protein J3Q66DRAFT_420362 [Benniella sp.]